MNPDRFQGCLLGLALGDALGAPHEGGVFERALWRILGVTTPGRSRWTDDTRMSMDIAESLVEHRALNADDLALRFARSYRWSRGYGPGAAQVLKRIRAGSDWRMANRSVHPEGSFGNGAAMRAPMVGLFFARRREELADAARLSASVTHVHPLGMEGAVLVSFAAALAVHGESARTILCEATAQCRLAPFTSRLAVASSWLESEYAASASEVQRELGNGIAASESCVTAVYIALRFLQSSFEEMHAFVVSCGGDVDTIGAMSGAVWGAANGAERLPARPLAKLEQRADLMQLAILLHDVARG